jgi:hypothetical protein
MKSKYLIPLAIIFAGGILFSCSKSIEKKISGTWKVEDVKFDTKRTLSEAQLANLESSKASAKEVSYELLEDYSAKVHVGKTVLEGIWTYKEAEAGIYMAFKGSFDTVLLGKLEQEKLINIATKPEITITTIFTKAE